MPAISRSRIAAMRARERFEPIAWRSWSASPAREAGDVDRHLHELLLEQRHAERLLQALLEQRVRVGHRLLAVASPQVGMHRPALDGTRADERDLHHEVVEALGAQARQRGHLRAALHLEHADGVGRAQQRVDLGLLRDGGEVDLDAFVLAHEVDGQVQHREHPEAEQVELHQAGGRAVVLVPLEHRAVLHARPLHRAELDQRTVGHHHAAGVDAEVAREVEHLVGEIERERRHRWRARFAVDDLRRTPCRHAPTGRSTW